MMPHPQTRTVTGNRFRRRRFSACHRHPNEPVTGFCALCLRDRLAGLDFSSGQAEKVVVCSRRTRGHGVAAFSSVPELRRSKSVAAGKCEVLNDFAVDPRRKSCDVRTRSTLSDLFVGDDSKNARDGGKRFDSSNLGFSTVAVVETKKEEDIDYRDEIKVSDDAIVQNEVDDDEIRVLNNVMTRNEIDDDDDSEIEEGDLKTMKEMIDIELENKRRNFWDAASVFSQKWRKWRHKQKEKKQSRCINGGTDTNTSKLLQSEVEDNRFGRRSCDTEPRFSIDAHRLSVEDPRFSFDEHRASWDGYMIARTIPRLTPMLSVVDNTMLAPANRVMNTATENLQMHSIREDGCASSSGSGGSGQSVSDSSTSNRGSSSSSMKSSSTKTAGSVGDDVKPASNARVSPANDVIFQGTKLVITEKELKDWHLNSIKNNTTTESVCNAPNSTNKTAVTNPPNGHKLINSSKWKKVCNLWGHKHKLDVTNGDKKNVEFMQENRVEIGNSNVNVVRNPSLVNSRNRRDEFMVDRNRNARYSTSDLDSGLLRLYLTPFRNSRRNKSGRSRGPSMATSGLQLN